MALYYLMSQLPSLDGMGENMPLPITEERFLELCGDFLGKKAQDELKKLSLIPSKNPEKSASPLIEAWNEGERNLRLVLGEIRAEKMNKSFKAENKSIPPQIIQAARTATEMQNPMEIENFLNIYRLNFLESLRPLDNFSDDSLYYYYLKLKLVSRMKQFSKENGESAYRNFYNSIMNGKGLEVAK